MTNKLLNDNCKSKEWVYFNMMDHEIQNEESGIQKSIVGVLGVSAESTDVFTQSLDVWAWLTNLLAQLAEVLVQSIDVLTQSINVMVQSTKDVQGKQRGVNTTNLRRLRMQSNGNMKSEVFIHSDDVM